ncbi:hypothetical protein Dda3937_03220 [Dickeya dadantii 3937]|uniref:Uncharacterized protein n=1 Tax=Dickeya dadantii (strain 3937) TaxID=198628 RepID=E0SME5_DICD3|nr:hypothetical protein Dda3937_03220 [Dickeya dadantii 3937]
MSLSSDRTARMIKNWKKGLTYAEKHGVQTGVAGCAGAGGYNGKSCGHCRRKFGFRSHVVIGRGYGGWDD